MSARMKQTWRPNAECSVKDCGQDAAYDRADGRCYRHGKEADGLMQRLESKAGRPATGSGYQGGHGRAHHRRRSA